MDRGLTMNSAWTAIVPFKILRLRPSAHRVTSRDGLASATWLAEQLNLLGLGLTPAALSWSSDEKDPSSL